VTHSWDPDRYLALADERARPFLDLVSRVAATAPSEVVDLGCGPGNLTDLLADRWPGAAVTGVDSSPEMVERAAGRGSPVRYRLGDLRDWADGASPGSVDVLVSNATLQWVPGHLGLLPALVRAVRPGGWLAFQVPGNVAEPSHVLTRALAAQEPYAAYTAGAAQPDAHDAATYLEALTALGCTVDAWETTYLHVLTGPDPVLGWISGTGARPFLLALPDDGPGGGLRGRFSAELGARLRAAYPERDGRVVLPFRRVFAVAQVAG
jgi:trans-aconitate 2-methyltransferase